MGLADAFCSMELMANKPCPTWLIPLESFPLSVESMLANTAGLLFQNSDWMYELKLYGYQIPVQVNGTRLAWSAAATTTSPSVSLRRIAPMLVVEIRYRPVAEVESRQANVLNRMESCHTFHFSANGRPAGLSTCRATSSRTTFLFI